MIIINQISKSFKDNILFENISLKFEEQRKILIKGINGSGKSVFLKLLVGYSTIDSGEIIIDDYILHKSGDFIPNSGISINSPEFINNLTGLENLLLLSDIRKIATKEDIIELAKKLELDMFLNKKYKNYSLGMKQKMRIIQALMDKPKYLILDEPFDALDHQSCEIVKKLFLDYVDNGCTLIYTTHNTEFEQFSDEVYEIDNRKLIKIK
ncbi:MAG: ATP-binding cassette domain-containing protein [Coprobacillus sp.]